METTQPDSIAMGRGGSFFGTVGKFLKPILKPLLKQGVSAGVNWGAKQLTNGINGVIGSGYGRRHCGSGLTIGSGLRVLN